MVKIRKIRRTLKEMTKLLFLGDIHGKAINPLKRLCSYNEDLFAKLEWIRDYANENKIDAVVHLGDIFDKPEATDEWKNKFIQIWKQYNGKFYSIIGMLHDLFYNNEQSYVKTCLYNLELSGVLKVIDNTTITIGDVELVSLNMRTKEAKKQLVAIPKSSSKYQIILAHQFYEWDLDKSAGFTEDEVSSIDHDCSLILGHDHRQHGTEHVNHVDIYRPGSLMRTELSETTIEQKPRVLLFDDGSFNYIEVPHKSIQEIYDVANYRVTKSTAKAFRNIKNNLADVSKYLHTDTTVKTCSEALEELKCPSAEFNYLKTVHQMSGLEF